jgi:hypothetical protein
MESDWLMKSLGNFIKRSIGVILFAAIPGMATGAATGIGPVLGALNGVATVFSSIIIYFGVQLAWDANISDEDIEKGFRAAVAKQASENKDIAAAVETGAKADDAFDSFGDITDLFDVHAGEATAEAAPAAEAAPEAPAN